MENVREPLHATLMVASRNCLCAPCEPCEHGSAGFMPGLSEGPTGKKRTPCGGRPTAKKQRRNCRQWTRRSSPFRLQIHGLCNVCLGLDKIRALAKAMPTLYIERGILRSDLDGALVSGDGLLPEALPAQADAPTSCSGIRRSLRRPFARTRILHALKSCVIWLARKLKS